MDRIAVEKNCFDCIGVNCEKCKSFSEFRGVDVRGPAKHDAAMRTITAFARQVGGQHYTDCAIQPFEYSMANKLDPMQHTIIKYVTRFRSKNGIVDLEKAKHTLELLIEWEKNHATQKN